MQTIVLAAFTVLCLVWIVVGIRILRVAARTRGLAECLLGGSLFLLGGISVPMNGIVRLVASGDWVAAVTIGASVVTSVALVMLYAFTALVFHQGQHWARAVVLAAAGSLVYYVIGHAADRMTATNAQEMLAVQMRWAPYTVLNALLAFAWAGSSAFVHWRRLRRRLALGLADPVVVDRLLLWSLFGAIAVAMTVAAGVLIVLGGTARDVIQPITTTIGGLAVSVVLLLAFSPPQSYLESVRRRAAAGGFA